MQNKEEGEKKFILAFSKKERMKMTRSGLAYGEVELLLKGHMFHMSNIQP